VTRKRCKVDDGLGGKRGKRGYKRVIWEAPKPQEEQDGRDRTTDDGGQGGDGERGRRRVEQGARSLPRRGKGGGMNIAGHHHPALVAGGGRMVGTCEYDYKVAP
jgi:hypothetical protein